MPTIQSTDQLGDIVEINFHPRRIVSLVPSQTELLFDLGLDEEIVGITRFCIHPAEKVKVKQKIGGTKRFNIEQIKLLQPDLIIGNKEENYEEGIEELRKHFPVWMSNIFTLDDAYNMMAELGRICNKETQAQQLVDEIRTGFNTLPAAAESKNAKVAYFIWRKPYMVAAGNTFIDHLIEACGMVNVFNHFERYPEIEPEALSALKPDFIFLSSEPYSFSEKHFEEFQSFAPNAKVVLVDGEMFSWYGSRLRLVPEYFRLLFQSLYS